MLLVRTGAAGARAGVVPVLPLQEGRNTKLRRAHRAQWAGAHAV